MTPDNIIIISHKTDRLLTSILGDYSSSGVQLNILPVASCIPKHLSSDGHGYNQSTVQENRVLDKVQAPSQQEFTIHMDAIEAMAV